MKRDTSAFRERFLRWKNGELVYDNGIPITSYDDGKDDLDSLLDAGYTGPYGTKGYTSDLVNSRIELRRQDRNNAIADRLQAVADATMLGVGLTGVGTVPEIIYFGARGADNIRRGDFVGGTLDLGATLIPAASKMRRTLRGAKRTNVRDYFRAHPEKLGRYNMNTGEGKQLSKFWNSDVNPRMKVALKDEGAVSPDVYNSWFNKNFAQSRRIWHGTTPFEPNPQGYSEGTNAIVFADNGSLFNTPEKRYSSLAHELHHSQRSNIERFRDAHTTNSNNGYTAQEEAALNNAYQFSEGFLNKHNIRPLHEKGAANTLLRATISANNGNATGKRLNKFIDNTSDEEITKILKSGSSYGADFVNSPTYNTKNIRKALKYVGGAAGVAYGLNKYDDGKDPTYNPKEGYLPEVTVSAKRTNFNPTYGYWDSLGQQWSTFNDLGLRIYRGAGWEPDVVLKTPQEYENYRLALWKKADPNRTFEFSDLIRGIADTALWASAPADAISELAGKYIINPLFNTTRAAIISRAINKAVRNFDDATKYTTHVKPQIRTKIGDIEIDNPNLLYHTDWGDGVGAMSKINESLGSPTHGGPIIKDGIIYPGAPYVEGQKGYTWWSLGKRWNNPGAGSRLTVAVKDHPDIVPVRSLKEPAGQWNGKSGFVTNSEYVASKGIDVSEGTYIFEPNYGYKKVLKDIPNRTINFYNVGNTSQTNALADFSYKGPSSIDTNSLFSDLRRRAFNDYVTGVIDNTSELLQFENLPPFETYSRPITESAQEIFNNSTLKRFARNRAAIEGVPEQFWLKGAENALPKEYYMVPRKIFTKLGESPKIQGLHFSKSDRILIPEDFNGFDLDEILNHEMRHSLDTNYDLLPEESKTLSDAYDDLFTPDVQDMVHDPKAEMTTTNRDARQRLIGSFHSAKTDPNLLNKIIDRMSGEDVIAALHKANGYGKTATKHLGLLDSEGHLDLDKLLKYVDSPEGLLRVKNIKAAMKYVPATLLGLPIFKHTQNKTAKKIK